ncbi:murein biosynthesis integral membrane protein MurJ [Acetobacter sp. TBRC 12305]|uniref:Probable lipid II flippase MurJ n=1 Tax=Acetobacter garciniae TaxID=2817435 RepID=A0A939HPP9_9PROT|nr:murein biosynthesis integral membrane protein MurJ [Acetobacter garciniae]MBO1325904.1 murein biosynthesis integral membrane protein MurJ [Acetobacter garciniae]MBX0345804.1 murein biosynthesis integral membrane protein MurJ [Acetobacter garciniae]
MLRNFLTVGGWTMLSRILGLVRDQLLAALMGAGALQDAYQVAFRLPNMFRRLFGEGAFNAAFVPLFSSVMTREGKDEARLFARQALGVMLGWLVFLCVLGEVFMPQILRVIAPGFLQNGDRYELAVSLSRITFPYLVLICAAALLAGVLNGLHRFGMASAAYLAFNVVGIAAILGAAPFFPNVAYAAAWGVTASGVVQLGLLAWACERARFGLSPLWPTLTPRIRLLLRRMVPGLIGSGVGQINLTIDTIIGTLLPAGSVSLMYFADRINQLPLGVLGAAAGTTLLPVLTRHLAAAEHDAAHNAQNRSIEYVLLLTLPAVAGLMVLADPIMIVLFGHGSFTQHDAMLSAQSLRAYAMGLPAFVLVKVLSPAFFARGDTRTPVYVGIAILVLNVLLNLAFMKPLAHMGPPLASSLAACINVACLAFLLWHRAALVLPATMTFRLARVLLAAVGMGAGLWLAGLGFPLPGAFFSRAVWLAGMVGVGVMAYPVLLHGLGVINLRSTGAAIGKRLGRR